MKKEGRKTKYTPELVTRICGLLEKDTYTVSELCESVGILRLEGQIFGVFGRYKKSGRKAARLFRCRGEKKPFEKDSGLRGERDPNSQYSGCGRKGESQADHQGAKDDKETYPTRHGGDHLRPYQPRPRTLEEPAEHRRQHSERCALHRFSVRPAECPGYRGDDEECPGTMPGKVLEGR